MEKNGAHQNRNNAFKTAYFSAMQTPIRHTINRQTWSRKEHFEFFSAFEDPFFGLVADVSCSRSVQFCKQENISFFLFSLHATLRAVNSIEELKLRLDDQHVYRYETIHCSPTVGRADHSFGFSFLEFEPDLTLFLRKAEPEIQRVKSSSGLCFDANAQRLDTIHCSSLPWVRFRSLSHARSFSFPDSMPKISYGKRFSEGGSLLMPVSLHLNHAFADGYHAGLFFEALETFLNEA